MHQNRHREVNVSISVQLSSRSLIRLISMVAICSRKFYFWLRATADRYNGCSDCFSDDRTVYSPCIFGCLVLQSCDGWQSRQWVDGSWVSACWPMTREWNPGTRVPENPGNPPIFKPVNPGLCVLKNPGLTGLVLGVSTTPKRDYWCFLCSVQLLSHRRTRQQLNKDILDLVCSIVAVRPCVCLWRLSARLML